MEKRKIYAVGMIILAILVLGVVFVNNQVELPPARFISAEASHPSFSPNEQIPVTYTYKNTWAEGYQFKVEGELDGGQYQYAKTGIVPAGTTFTNTMYFTAPSTEGVNTIDLDGSIYFGHWVDGDGHASININVVDPQANLIISSNVPNVIISCSNGNEYLIDDTNQVIIENLDLNTEYQFGATSEGYFSEIFNIIPVEVDNTYALTLSEIPVPEDPVVEDPIATEETPEIEFEEDVPETPTNEELIQDNEKVTFEMIQTNETGDESTPDYIIYIAVAIAFILLVSGLFLMRE